MEDLEQACTAYSSVPIVVISSLATPAAAHKDKVARYNPARRITRRSTKLHEHEEKDWRDQ